jgi:hypothetical protein
MKGKERNCFRSTGMNVVVFTPQSGIQYIVRFAFVIPYHYIFQYLVGSLFGLLVLFQSVVIVKCLCLVLGFSVSNVETLDSNIRVLVK